MADDKHEHNPNNDPEHDAKHDLSINSRINSSDLAPEAQNSESKKFEDPYFSSLVKAPPGVADEDQFCYYPFTQLFLDPRGRAAPCCWNQDYILGNIKSSSLEELWNGHKLQELRRQFIVGKPVACAQQMKDIRCHRYSRREYAQDISVSPVQAQRPSRFDVRLNGLCNLSCVMCDVWEMPNGNYTHTDFWSKGPTEFFPKLKEIDVLGGEPLVQKDTFRLIDEISAVNRYCTWAFVTNGHYTVSDTIISRLDKILIRWIQVSVDSLDSDTYPKIRIKGRLAKTLDTVKRLNEYRRIRRDQHRGFGLTASMCVQKLNWREVESFLRWTQELDLLPILQFAYDPSEVSLLDLSVTERMSILRDWESLEPRMPENALHPLIQPLRDSLT
jgi:cyclic pyranopterin phosphate synthase